MSKYVKISDLSEAELLERRLEQRQAARCKFMRRVMESLRNSKSKTAFCVRYLNAMTLIQVGTMRGMQPWECVSVAWLMRSHPSTSAAIERLNKLAIDRACGGHADGPRHMTFDEIAGTEVQRHQVVVFRNAFSRDWYLYRDDSNAMDDMSKVIEEAAQ